MRVSVDMKKCEDHGQCAIAAPDVFTINDEGHLVYDENPDDNLRQDVEDAQDVCPVQAILINE